jgi:hypothetical protein
MHTFSAKGGPYAVAKAMVAALAVPLAEDRRRVAGTYRWDRVLPRIEAVVEKALA